MNRPSTEGAVFGSCLCGGVTVVLAEAHCDVGVCHCRMCRQWTSGPWMALQVPGSQISGDTLCRFKSSRFAERGFCGRCGSHIYHRPADGPELAISAGLFDDAGFYIAREIFIDAKPPWYHFVSGSEKRSSVRMALEWAPKLAWRKLGRVLGFSTRF